MIEADADLTHLILLSASDTARDKTIHVVRVGGVGFVEEMCSPRLKKSSGSRGSVVAPHKKYLAVSKRISMYAVGDAHSLR